MIEDQDKNYYYGTSALDMRVVEAEKVVKEKQVALDIVRAEYQELGHMYPRNDHDIGDAMKVLRGKCQDRGHARNMFKMTFTQQDYIQPMLIHNLNELSAAH